MGFTKQSLNGLFTIIRSKSNVGIGAMATPLGGRGLSSASQAVAAGAKEVEEVIIPTPWGHIAGVWWGPRDKKPLLALHGWQDNANTWRPLVPLLPHDLSVLAIDFQGHGRSSRYPPGMFYYFPDNVVTMRRVVHHFGWKSVGLLGHSMGAISSFMYAGCYPAQVDFMIQLDNIKPITARKENYIAKLAENIDSLLLIDKRNVCGSEPPSYTPDELVERLHLGSSKSISREFCSVLLERGSARAARDSSKYFYTRDYRIVLNAHLGLSNDDVDAMALRLSCPILTIKFENGSYFEPKEEYYRIVDLLKSTNKNFEFVTVPGTHHGHLENAHHVAPIITEFLKKHLK